MQEGEIIKVARRVFDWTVPYFPLKMQILVTRYGLWTWTCFGRRRFPVMIMRGRTKPSGQLGTLLVVGHDPWVGYLPDQFFMEDPKHELVDNVLARQLPSLLNRLQSSVDLTIVRMDRLSAPKLFGNEYLVVPEWVGLRLTIPEDLDALVRGNRSIREDIRLVRRHKLRPLVTEGEDRFGEFYDSIYRPFTETRFGPGCIIQDRQYLRGRVKKGGILWVLREDYCLAAMLFEKKGQMLHLYALGTATGDLPVKKRGIMAALYFYTIAHARQLGCKKVDFKGTRPSLHDGVLRYKRKWGNTLYDQPDTYHDLLIRWNSANGVVKDFFSHTGLIFREGERFSAIYANESQKPHALWVGGLHRLYRLTESGRQVMIKDEESFNKNNQGLA